MDKHAVAVAAVIVAFIAGIFATWNARKHPHERLKSLVDIRKEIGSSDPGSVIETAIQREIGKIKRLNEARVRGAFAFLATGLQQRAAYVGSLVTGAALFVTVFWTFTDERPLALGAAIIGLVVSGGSIFLNDKEREADAEQARTGRLVGLVEQEVARALDDEAKDDLPKAD